ncbi:MAG: helix-turn-helix domain-containing protein [Alphaproteobacteria bacterium]
MSPVAARTVPARGRPRVDQKARREDYLQAAAKVFLAQGSQASMQQVAEAAGAQKPVFYRIFPSRAALIDALFQRVFDVIFEVQARPWEGYGWTLKAVYLAAKPEREVFLAVLTTFRADPALQAWRDRLLALVHEHSKGFFEPASGAPPGGAKRAEFASKSLNSLFFETLADWLTDRDGLTDEARFTWYARIVREWRKATREAYRLDDPRA